MQLNITISVKHLLLGILFLGIAFLTANGTVQQHIYFAGAKNEFAFLSVSAMLGFMLIVTSFSKNK